MRPATSNARVVSILMNCYNGAKYLKPALESVLKQNYQNWELIFIDNHSTDSSIDIFNNYRGDKRLYYYSTPEHMSLGEAREFGMSYCDGDYICFLDTDDIWRPDKLEQQIMTMSADSEILLTYSSFYFINEYGKITGKRKVRGRKGLLFGDNLANYEVNFQTLMIKREALNKLEKPFFNPSLKFSPDYNLVMRLLSSGIAVSSSEALVYYRKTANSLTNRTIHLWGEESEFTYKYLERYGYLTELASPSQCLAALAKINYYKALYAASRKDYKAVRNLLNQYKHVNYRYLVLYLLSFSPYLWEFIHELKK